MIDLHCDTVWAIEKAKEKGEACSLKRSSFQIDEEKLIKGNYFAQCFAMFVPNNAENRFEKCAAMISLYYEELKKCERLVPAYSYADLIKNRENHKISAILTMEDGCPIGESLENLEKLYARGVRMVGLTWDYPNALGAPNRNKALYGENPDPFTPDTTRGLTELGKAAVKKMNELGVIVDVAHLSDAGFNDVANITQKPFVASHANARALCRHVRNLTDEQLKKLADKGGVVGTTYVKWFLHEREAEGAQTLDCLIPHIKHIQKIVGIEHIAIGSDYDGMKNDIALCDASKAPLLIARLEKEGFSTEEIEKITYKNALRVFKECLR